MIVSLDYSIMVIELVCIRCLYNAVSRLQFFNKMLTLFELLLATGSIRNTTFSNIVIDTYYYDPSWWGNSEPMYVAACPRDPLTKVSYPTHTNSYFRIEPNEFPARVSSWCTRPNAWQQGQSSSEPHIWVLQILSNFMLHIFVSKALQHIIWRETSNQITWPVADRKKLLWSLARMSFLCCDLSWAHVRLLFEQQKKLL